MASPSSSLEGKEAIKEGAGLQTASGACVVMDQVRFAGVQQEHLPNVCRVVQCMVQPELEV